MLSHLAGDPSPGPLETHLRASQIDIDAESQVLLFLPDQHSSYLVDRILSFHCTRTL